MPAIRMPHHDLAYTDDVLGEDLQQNYAQVRVERGQSWAQMAADFDRAGEKRLAAWARGNGRAEQVDEQASRGEVAPAGRATPGPKIIKG